MSRSGQLLAAGFAVVLVGCLVLWRVTVRDDAAASSTAPAGKPAGDAKPAREEAPAAPPSAKADEPAKPAAIEPLKTARRTTSKPSLVESYTPPQDDVGVEYDINGKPIPVANLATLRQVAATTDDAIRACLAKSPQKITGKATVTYIVARKFDSAGQPVVAAESSSAEDDGTTIDNADVVECLHKTAFAMKFPPSKSPIAVWARRRIVVENGLLAESHVVEFGRIR